ncbi:Wzz/FepE/Etk N-terminal domain-containing protein [Spirosoma luteolum]
MPTLQDTSMKDQYESHEIEIRLSDIIQFLRISRRRALIGALLGLGLGIAYAFSKPNLYTSEVTVMPEIAAKSGGSLSGLGSIAGLAGISLDNVSGTDAVRPDLYPRVLQSVPFALDLLKRPVYVKKTKATVSLRQFMEANASGGLLKSFSGLFSGGSNGQDISDPANFSKAIQLTKEDSELVKKLTTDVSGVYDKKTGVLTITVTQEDPVVAATVARLSLEYLTNYVTAYRTEKARGQVAFLNRQVGEAKKRYQAAELALSAYRDQNRSLYLNTAKIDEQRLQADYLLTQSVYNDLSKQLEQSRIKVQEETPVFKVLEPATIPLLKSGPKRTVMMLVGLVLGALAGVSVSLIYYLRSRKLRATL